jgi:hypothetical protein
MPSGVPMASATAAPRRASGKPRGKVAGRKGSAWLARWWKVAVLVALATIGLPLAHALFGEVVALLGLSALVGFLLGRWTAR